MIVRPGNGVHAVDSNRAGTWSSKNRSVDTSSSIDTRPSRLAWPLASRWRNYVVHTKDTARIRHRAENTSTARKTVLNHLDRRTTPKTSEPNMAPPILVKQKNKTKSTPSSAKPSKIAEIYTIGGIG